jgi:hypothetical protein
MLAHVVEGRALTGEELERCCPWWYIMGNPFMNRHPAASACSRNFDFQGT